MPASSEQSIDALKLLQVAVRMSCERNSRKYMNSLYYLLENEGQEDHPQHRYFKLYEKYTSEASDTFTFQDEPIQERPSLISNSSNQIEVQDWKNKQETLQKQNKYLRKEVAEQKEIIEKLKYQLFYCNTQLEQITKIESVEYQKAIEDLKREIEHMLEKTSSFHDQHSNQSRIVQFKPTIQLKNINKNHKYAFISNQNKENQQTKPILTSNRVNKQDTINRQFLLGLKDMYGKIVGGSAKSLKELWKWLKDIALMASRIKKWGKKYRQFKKSTLQAQTQTLLQFLDEALVIIN